MYVDSDYAKTTSSFWRYLLWEPFPFTGAKKWIA